MDLERHLSSGIFGELCNPSSPPTSYYTNNHLGRHLPSPTSILETIAPNTLETSSRRRNNGSDLIPKQTSNTFRSLGRRRTYVTEEMIHENETMELADHKAGRAKLAARQRSHSSAAEPALIQGRSNFRPAPYSTAAELDAIFGMTKAQKRQQNLRTRDEDGRLYYDHIEKEEWRHLLGPASPAFSRRSSSQSSGTGGSPASSYFQGRRRSSVAGTMLVVEAPENVPFCSTSHLPITMLTVNDIRNLNRQEGVEGVVSSFHLKLSINTDSDKLCSVRDGSRSSPLSSPSSDATVVDGHENEKISQVLQHPGHQNPKPADADTGIARGNLDLDLCVQERLVSTDTPTAFCEESKVDRLEPRRTRRKRSGSAVEKANHVGSRLDLLSICSKGVKDPSIEESISFLDPFRSRSREASLVASSLSRQGADLLEGNGPCESKAIRLPSFLPLARRKPTRKLLDEAFKSTDVSPGNVEPKKDHQEETSAIATQETERMRFRGRKRPAPLELHKTNFETIKPPTTPSHQPVDADRGPSGKTVETNVAGHKVDVSAGVTSTGNGLLTRGGGSESSKTPSKGSPLSKFSPTSPPSSSAKEDPKKRRPFSICVDSPTPSIKASALSSRSPSFSLPLSPISSIHTSTSLLSNGLHEHRSYPALKGLDGSDLANGKEPPSSPCNRRTPEESIEEMVAEYDDASTMADGDHHLSLSRRRHRDQDKGLFRKADEGRDVKGTINTDRLHLISSNSSRSSSSAGSSISRRRASELDEEGAEKSTRSLFNDLRGPHAAEKGEGSGEENRKGSLGVKRSFANLRGLVFQTRGGGKEGGKRIGRPAAAADAPRTYKDPTISCLYGGRNGVGDRGGLGTGLQMYQGVEFPCPSIHLCSDPEDGEDDEDNDGKGEGSLSGGRAARHASKKKEKKKKKKENSCKTFAVVREGGDILHDEGGKQNPDGPGERRNEAVGEKGGGGGAQRHPSFSSYEGGGFSSRSSSGGGRGGFKGWMRRVRKT
ncbi:hypothetical protein IE53DRAFT_283704 [Violaceomyces palustris]|uniref:Uncharacterized protein n=1 Tax=Violaceomyces palustris TaxID=1673888 RepID=A0ACD0NM52_9BASI|nr:hypothetical protein IE53DRAFT_283704 [Violaceomyces palustris]